jgi:hypothetical protein
MTPPWWLLGLHHGPHYYRSTTERDQSFVVVEFVPLLGLSCPLIALESEACLLRHTNAMISDVYFNCRDKAQCLGNHHLPGRRNDSPSWITMSRKSSFSTIFSNMSPLIW